MKIKLPLILLFVCFAAGCTTVTEAGYYWGSYAPTLYNYTKLPSDETLAAHRESLEDIIAKSNEKNLRVPPGVYAELGYIEQKRGDQDASTAYYESEMKLYPEATPFLERLVSGMKKEDGESL